MISRPLFQGLFSLYTTSVRLWASSLFGILKLEKIRQKSIEIYKGGNTMKYILSLDQGTTSSRAILLADSGL